MVSVETQLLTNPFVYVVLFATCIGLWLFFRRRKPELPVIFFEKIGKVFPHSALSEEWTSTKSLLSLFNYLSRRGFTSITPEDLSHPLPPKPVLLAFLGGYRSFYQKVFPLLKKHKIKATLFVATDLVGTYNSWQDPHQEPWQDLVTKEELQEMHASGFVSVGVLPLKADDISTLPLEKAEFALTESAYRFEHQFGFAPKASCNYPARRTDSNIASLPLWNNQHPLFIISEEHNMLPLKNFVLNGFFFNRPLWYTRLLLWKLR